MGRPDNEGRIAPASPRTCIEPFLLSAPHLALRATFPGSRRGEPPRSRDMNVLERAASEQVVDDIVLPFAVESLSTRGRLVRLGPAIDQLLKRHEYPEAASKLVAEAATLAALLGSTLKTSGRFQLQTKSDGPVTMLLVDFDAPSHLRALARFDKGRLERAAEAGDDLLGQGHMAFTIDPGGEMTRY